MADQDPCPESIAGDSGHKTMAMAVEAESDTGNGQLVGAVGGIDKGIATGCITDVEWRDEDTSIEINDENVTVP